MHKIYRTSRRCRLGRLIAIGISLFLQKAHAQQGILFESNPIPDRYFFTPSGLRAEAGKRTFQNTSLIFFHTNNTKSKGKSFGWGLVPTFLTGQTTDIPIWLTAAKRWQTRNPKINPWVGTFLLKLPEEAESDAWIFHSGITFGTKEKHLSAGAFIGSFDEKKPPFKGVMLNGQVRLGQKTWLICENHLVIQPSLVPVCLWGFRKKTRALALELGLGWTKTKPINPESTQQTSIYVPFPWLSAVFGLPQKREIPDFLRQGGVR